MDTKRLKVDLQSFGVKIENLKERVRNFGAGPASNITFSINEIPINAPVTDFLTKTSPYEIKKESNEFKLFKSDKYVADVQLPPLPNFYNEKTDEGVPYHKIALFHGCDCIATTVFQTCDFWREGLQCKFCAIEFSLKNDATIPVKSPENLAEVALYAKVHDKVSFFTMTTGVSRNPEKLLKHLCKCIHEIKTKSGLGVHIQISPMGSLKGIKELYDAGADTIGIHIESFDKNVRNNLLPGKNKIDIETYKLFWKEAVNVFGKNQVSSFIVTGLGESINSVLEGSEMLCEIGVYPYIVPLHPVPQTPLEHKRSLDPETQIRIYEEASRFLKKYGLSWKKSLAGCVRCRSCSAISEFEDIT
ncbi:MAG: hypothetical protein A2149_01025 [Candidatus Schekmanbacteria bacterium RBG_16_38_11]|uniref:Radical SAM core domain-containing protein n=1 Tax=Candidatus Schekmanbacteria bacterium RBG_16_38_11 TaxID=1817880 RepID=A0A1F7S2M6_9BACT|nr:MAG: hypothetical protein A2149_01025 [Candidatus Schekmanbacteria bacterium RBG_16_38_11]